MDYFENEHAEYRPETPQDFAAAVTAHFERTGVLSDMLRYVGGDMSVERQE